MWPFPSQSENLQPIDDPDAHRDILAGQSADKSHRRWSRLLVFYLRGLSLFCLVRGLTDWSRILGLLGEPDTFDSASTLWQISIVAFAVINCITSVGLWLTSAWGAVLWLMLTLTEVFIPFVTNDTVRAGGLGDIVLMAMIVVYIVLTWRAVKERETPR
jgi:Family of unknown function (DUF6163)/Predicted membrane protein (DUF2127)